MQNSLFQNIPLELRTLRQWLVWDPARGKMPLQRDLKLASIHDANQFLSFEEAVAIGLGIGFVFTPNDPYGGFDLDPVPPKEPKRDAVLAEQASIYNSTSSYAERSPSGEGLHIIAKGNLPHGRHPKYIGVFTEGRFFTFTGNVYRQAPINDEQAVFDRYKIEPNVSLPIEEQLEDDAEICRQLNKSPLALKLATVDITFTKDYPEKPGSNPSDYYSWSEADMALLNIIAYQTQNEDQIERIFTSTPLHTLRPTIKGRNYLKDSIRKAIPKMVPLVDTSALERPEIKAIAEAIKETNPVPKKPMTNPYLAPIPGLMGEIATFIYNAAPRPVPEIALAGAVALMAGIAGRSWNTYTGAGLNLYILLLAPTGRGKEAMAQGIERLCAACDAYPNIPEIHKFRGPGDIVSGNALANYIADGNKSFLSIVGEFGLKLQQLANPRPTTADTTLMRQLLDLYNKSGKGNVLRGSIYAEKAKNTADTIAPAFSLLGETVPDRFYRIVTDDMIAAGLIPRLLVIDYEGERPLLNEEAGNYKPTDGLIQRVRELVGYAVQKNAKDDVVPVPLSEDARKLFAAFDIVCDNFINGSQKDVIQQLWNRGHIKALKLASLAAVGENYHSPVVSAYHANWAIAIVKHDINKMVKKFDAGLFDHTPNDEIRQVEEITRVMKDYLTFEYDRTKSYAPFPKMHEDKVIPERYISKRLCPTSLFKKSPLGASRALDMALKIMISNGDVSALTSAEILTKYNTNSKVYRVSQHFIDAMNDAVDD